MAKASKAAAKPAGKAAKAGQKAEVKAGKKKQPVKQVRTVKAQPSTGLSECL